MWRRRQHRPEQEVVSAVGGVSDVLPQDDKVWWKKPHLLKLNFLILSFVLFSSSNGYDGSLMNGLQALPLWQDFMGHPNGAWLGFINGAPSLGSIIATWPAAWVSQSWGRKSGIYIGYFFLVTSVILQTVAPNVAAFIAGRLLIGFTSQFYANSAPLLIAETAYPSHRAIVTALYMCGWYVGSLIAAWATFATRNYTTDWSWKIPVLLQIAIPLASLPGTLLAPESPRWYVAQDKLDKATEVLVQYHGGGVHDAVVGFEIQEIVSALQTEKAALSTTSWASLIQTKGNRHRMLISASLGFFAQWNGVNVVSYYFVMMLEAAGIRSLDHQTLLNACIQIWNLIFAVTAAFAVDRIGRRRLFLISGFGMLASYICITALSASFAKTSSAPIGTAVIPFLFIFYAFYDIAYTPLLIAYPAEIWPYMFRSRGLAVTILSSQAAVLLNVFVNPIALDAIAWKYYIVFVIVLSLLILTVWFFYPETKGHTLEEMAVIFDGPDAAVFGKMEVGDTGRRAKGSSIEVVHEENLGGDETRG
ncbi:general substrate transporter [Aspergillus cavernicola]|uniref:General substrate transporter n=1 Tax=Aspergillus cavernicola TaxID=176166 RepID=A0ABR4IQ66_9EURO